MKLIHEENRIKKGLTRDRTRVEEDEWIHEVVGTVLHEEGAEELAGQLDVRKPLVQPQRWRCRVGHQGFVVHRCAMPGKEESRIQLGYGDHIHRDTNLTVVLWYLLWWNRFNFQGPWCERFEKFRVKVTEQKNDGPLLVILWPETNKRP